MQTVAWIVTLIVMAFIACVFLFVVYNASGKRAPYEPIVKVWYKVRSVYGITLITIMVVLCIYTLRELPFDKPVYSEGVEPTIIDAESVQFGFLLSQTEVKAGEPVEFHVTSSDVNHGFGIYDENMNLLAQTQAMPGITNKVYYTFEKPGTYQILCLEYCGLGHHLMIASFTVK